MLLARSRGWWRRRRDPARAAAAQQVRKDAELDAAVARDRSYAEAQMRGHLPTYLGPGS